MLSTAAQLDRVLLPFSAVFGAVIGSFINAAVYRIPRNISLWKEKRSFCPQCRAQIAWHDNIPVLSYLLLLGRCRSCRKRIPGRYLVVELLTAGLFAAIYWHVRILNGPEAAAAGRMTALGWEHLGAYLALTAGLILAAFCDIEDYEETPEQKREREKRARKLKAAGKDIEDEEGPSVYGIIPDEVTVTGLCLALPLALLLPAIHWNALRLVPPLELGGPALDLAGRLNAGIDALLGAAVGGGMIWLTGLFGKLVFRKEAMGFGDVLFVAMIGSILGWKAALLVFFLAPVFGSIFGITMRVLRGERYVRYGPFLAAAAVLVIFYEPLLSAYFETAFRGLAAALQGGAEPGTDWWHLHHRVPFVDFEKTTRGIAWP
ncbi:MAG TPA: prepilin peptidase [Planctomycetota bacterium]|nr:prepilin peptidase [Planctomycetota bacterium]